MIVKYLYLMWLYFSACVLNYGIAFLLPNFYNLGVYVILTIVTSIVITTEFLMGVIKNQYQQNKFTRYIFSPLMPISSLYTALVIGMSFESELIQLSVFVFFTVLYLHMVNRFWGLK